MGITVAQSSVGATSGGSSALATSFAAPTTAGNGIVVRVGSFSRGATSVTDDAGNTYLKAEEATFFSSPFAAVWYCANPLPLTTVTANFAAGTNCWVVADEVVGKLTFDTGNAGSANAANAQPGAITTTGTNRLVVNAVVTAGGAVSAAPAGDTPVYLNAGFGGSYQAYGTVQTGLNPQWTSAAGGYGCVVAAFSSTGALGASRAMPPRTFRLPLPFGPWAFGLPVLPSPRFVPTPAPPHADVLPVLAGVPLYPLALRLGLFGQLPSAPPPYRAAPPAPPPPPPPGPGRGKRAPFVRRQTSFSDDSRRLRRILDDLSVRLNSLVGQGILRETSQGVWQIVGGSHVAAVDPTAADDTLQGFVPGSMWLNSATRTGFMCVDNTQGAAVWRQVT